MTKQKEAVSKEAVPKKAISLTHFKEYVAATIAVVVVVGMVIMMTIALFTTGDDVQFSRIKDLLLIINPLVGVVLGYYFNKVSTEARAENAEATAQSAVANAQEAGKARDNAMVEVQAAKSETDKAKTDLATSHQHAEEMQGAFQDVSQAAEKVLGEASTQQESILSGASRGGPGEPAGEALQELQAALRRAKRVMG